MIERSVVVNKKTGNRGYFYQCPRCGKKVRYDARQNASDLVCKNCGDLRLVEISKTWSAPVGSFVHASAQT